MGQERPPQEFRATSWASQQPQPPQVVSRAESPATEVQYDRTTPLAPQLFRNSWTHQDSPRSPTGNRRPPQSTFRREPSRVSFTRPQASRQDLAHQGQQSSMVGVYSNLSSPVTAPDSHVQITQLPSSIEGSQHSSSSTEQSPPPPKVPDQVEGSLMGIKAHSVNEPPAVVPSPQSAQQNKESGTPGTIATPQRKVDKVPALLRHKESLQAQERDSQATSDQPRDPSVTTGSKVTQASLQCPVTHQPPCTLSPSHQ